MTRLGRIAGILAVLIFALMLFAAVLMAHGAITLRGAVLDGRERGRMVAEIHMDVARMQAQADMALDR